ncbi:cytochrome ubiquinol oxidase subunit I [Paenibacillus xerothermodurans]|uniref:Cytochrome ubiquinol oxidase subunit I n=1 Tax=Paenibacillus xerothermodurans TaxID=1977292 RepID=A0A2W1P3N8_PAEXE|nr:cytochrome ubiquinol oxidase subunit I [Paenibacillus xerothermodurans]PZE21778.1 cytochrome ubiquinol oxidase subunit I [Paenibacillus xerothermodurans]
MDTVDLARALFGSSMAFHIIFSTLGVGIPAMIVVAELLYHVKKDSDYSLMAQRWTRGLAILLGVAIPSGTIVGVMLTLLWPGFMEYVGEVIALPFQIELWAFFLEALFLSIYVYAADRLPPVMRIVSVAFVAFGAVASAVLITDAHSWMNTPRGFSVVNDQITDVNPLAAVFNPSVWTTTNHVVTSAYMTGAFTIASVAAYKMLSRRLSEREFAYHGKGLFMSLLIGGVMAVLTAVDGHSTAQMLHHHQPEKLAGAEGLFETTAYAPLVIFGTVDPEIQGVRGGLELPWALSFLATNRFSGVVRGLNEFPPENWPPLYIHTLFDTMVMIGSILIVMGFVPLAYRMWFKKPYPRWMTMALVTAGPLSMLGIETGWIFSCTGRQPWTIYHVQRTAEAATRAGGLGALLVMFVSIYVILLVTTAVVMRHYFNRHPVGPELTQDGSVSSR